MDWIGGIAAQNKLTDRGNRLFPSGKVLKAGNVITDGPYTEIKESIVGYSIVKADSIEEATELAKGCPALKSGGNVEIREINATIECLIYRNTCLCTFAKAFIFMNQTELIPHLFRTEYRKIVSVLCKLFGIDHMEIAEDIVSDTFLSASELWGLKGLPENPTAWLYTVAKNKTKDYLRRNSLFAKTISKEIKYGATGSEEIEIDLSVKNINDSQLAMIFVVCHPCNPPEAQIGLALNLLCGFGPDEIANAFLTDKEVIYKRLQRARKKLRTEKIKIEQPGLSEINDRLPAVLMTLYLFYNEGYYSSVQDIAIREDLCFEAMRLTNLLLENEQTKHPP